MPTIKLVIEFDGAAYIGWQRQAVPGSLQQLLEEALEKVTGTPVRLHSSGRTDAGVHARGMAAHFSVERLLSLGAYREGVNHFLPADVAVQNAELVDDAFHARFSAVGKWYRYTIWQGEVRSPLLSNRYWHLRSDLDLIAMRRAAAMLVGRHDFSAFRSSGCDAVTTERELVGIEIIAEGKLIHIDVAGDGFLRNMVRIIAGTLVEVGLGKRTPESVAELLESGLRTVAGITAPAAGLCLMRVWYDLSLEEMCEQYLLREKSLTSPME